MLMSGPGFIRIERGSDVAHVLKLNKVTRHAHFCIILSELGNFMYVFNCRLAVKCYFFTKCCTFSSIFGILNTFFIFRRQSWILAVILNLFMVIRVQNIS